MKEGLTECLTGSAEGYRRISIEALSPIEVAEQTGQTGIKNLLLAAGAKRFGRTF